MNKEIRQLAGLVQEADKVAFFGGAGVSTESGIPDFRSAQGLFHQQRAIPPETILSRSFFLSQPEMFFDYYKENLVAPQARPNPAHQALAALEKAGKLVGVVTQNIDGLHQAAGSKNVLELHGSVHRNFCMRCNKAHALAHVMESPGLPMCGCGGLVRPDVVLYEEGLDDRVTREAARLIAGSDLLIVGGTSLNVYPAAGYVRLCPGKLVIINRDPTPMDRQADLLIRSPIGQTFAQLMALLGTDGAGPA
ncbi:MAG: NAD-dependent protein deacylase [Clostridiales bacterium]|mgnify:CR=1 FL=1|nr:NAD-dependent protein deacylase [Clostridiales bacterium]